MRCNKLYNIEQGETLKFTLESDILDGVDFRVLLCKDGREAYSATKAELERVDTGTYRCTVPSSATKKWRTGKYEIELLLRGEDDRIASEMVFNVVDSVSKKYV